MVLATWLNPHYIIIVLIVSRFVLKSAGATNQCLKVHHVYGQLVKDSMNLKCAK